MTLQNKIGFDTIIVKKEGLDAVSVDEEKVMMDIKRGKYYALNDVGSCIWELISNPRTIMEIISELLEEYDVDTETCQKSVLEFIDRLYYEEIICIINEN